MRAAWCELWNVDTGRELGETIWDYLAVVEGLFDSSRVQWNGDTRAFLAGFDRWERRKKTCVHCARGPLKEKKKDP